jgi:hypothetical protein
MDMKSKALATLMVLTSFVGIVLGADTSTDINWTYLAGIISGSAVILGAILVVIIAVVPILIVLALVSFVVGLYTAILGHVERIL